MVEAIITFQVGVLNGLENEQSRFKPKLKVLIAFFAYAFLFKC